MQPEKALANIIMDYTKFGSGVQIVADQMDLSKKARFAGSPGDGRAMFLKVRTLVKLNPAKRLMSTCPAAVFVLHCRQVLNWIG